MHKRDMLFQIARLREPLFAHRTRKPALARMHHLMLVIIRHPTKGLCTELATQQLLLLVLCPYVHAQFVLIDKLQIALFARHLWIVALLVGAQVAHPLAADWTDLAIESVLGVQMLSHVTRSGQR